MMAGSWEWTIPMLWGGGGINSHAVQANKQMCGWQSAPQQAMMWEEKSSNSCTMQEVATGGQEGATRTQVATGGQEGATRTQGVSALAGVRLRVPTDQSKIYLVFIWAAACYFSDFCVNLLIRAFLKFYLGKGHLDGNRHSHSC